MNELPSKLREPLPQTISTRRDYLEDFRSLLRADNPRLNVAIVGCGLVSLALFSTADNLKNIFIR